MKGRRLTWLDRLKAFWRALAPGLHDIECTTVALDEWRTELRWRAAPLVFDRRSKTIWERRRLVARYAQVQAVEIEHLRGDDAPDHWRVSLVHEKGRLRLGMSRDDAEASLAAARASELCDAKVRLR
ncbi:hypothetical protein [Pelomonas sp. SE-A7]|uniref:hypothetical protein n=1 Tax=Pelomonas sp. SE-A7 TaxID=3054953 RepID=UPI00259CA4FD|nr:hypothetical protein [Pelomonas sp. SE-A7]MDM4766865.1 hypothetical protein [Pelomonas sp. SE-A7]